MARLTRCDVCGAELVQGNLHYWIADYGDRVVKDYCERDFLSSSAADIVIALTDRGPMRVLMEAVI